MQILPQINYISCKNQYEEYRMFYTAWGNPETSSKTLLCVHGLGRNGRDWDLISNYFAGKGYYVVAPDIVGHGNSDYLKNPAGYGLANCAADIMQLIKILNLANISWLGTSMGGLIGISIAAAAHTPLQKMILNDIGAEVERSGLNRIANSYSKNPVKFDSYTLAKDYIINISREFGDLPDKIWQNFAANCLQKNSEGKYVLKRDILIGGSIDTTTTNNALNLWPYWKQVTIPTLIIRGEYSDILTMQTIRKMQETNIRTEYIEIAKAGHAPFLYSDMHFAMLAKFLN